MRARTALVICGDGIVAERLCQQPVHTQLAWIAEDRQSDGHAVVTGRGRRRGRFRTAGPTTAD